jgi:hypothetical protein
MSHLRSPRATIWPTLRAIEISSLACKEIKKDIQHIIRRQTVSFWLQKPALDCRIQPTDYGIRQGLYRERVCPLANAFGL